LQNFQINKIKSNMKDKYLVNLAKLAVFLHELPKDYPVKFDMAGYARIGVAEGRQGISVNPRDFTTVGPNKTSCGCAVGFAALANVGNPDVRWWQDYVGESLIDNYNSQGLGRDGAYTTMFSEYWDNNVKFAAKRIAWWLTYEETLVPEDLMGQGNTLRADGGETGYYNRAFNQFKPNWDSIKKLANGGTTQEYMEAVKGEE